MPASLLMNQRKSAGPFAETQMDPMQEVLDQGRFREIFSTELLPQTTGHVYAQLGSPESGLTSLQLNTICKLLNIIELLATESGGALSEYTAQEDGASLSITKATDFLSPDYHFSYNKVSLRLDDLSIEWYFLLSDGETDVKGDSLQNVQKDPAKAEIMYEKNESNKVKDKNRNNTGYLFRNSNGKLLDHGDVETFINRKKTEGDPRFIKDFPLVEEGEQPPTYTIQGLKQPFYAFDRRLGDPLKDKNNLQSDVLKGNSELEQAYDGHIFIDSRSKGDCVVRIQQALNIVYKNDPAYVPLKESGEYDGPTKATVTRFQSDNKLKGGTNGIVGKETLAKLDASPTLNYSWSPSAVEPISFVPQVAMTYATGGLNSLIPRKDPPDIKAAKSLVSFRPPASTYEELKTRADNTIFNGEWNHWSVQHIEEAEGTNVNIDWYGVNVTVLPINPITKVKFTAEGLQEYIRTHLNEFFDQDISQFEEYSPQDGIKWKSQAPLNSVMHFDICTGPWFAMWPTLGNPDDLSVITSEYAPDHWMFSTIRSPDDCEHPVSGNREFGFSTNTDGSLTFYTRGADRATGVMDSAFESDVFAGGHSKWLAYQKNLAAFVNNNQGRAITPQPYSERFGWLEFQQKFGK